jgi:hypothetical protein
MVHDLRITPSEAALIAAGLGEYNTFSEVHDEIATREEIAVSQADEKGRPAQDLRLGDLKRRFSIAALIDDELTKNMVISYPFVKDSALFELFQRTDIVEFGEDVIDPINTVSSRSRYADYFVSLGKIEFARNLDPLSEQRMPPKRNEKKLPDSKEKLYLQAIAAMAAVIADHLGKAGLSGESVNRDAIKKLVVKKCQQIRKVEEHDKCGMSNVNNWITQGQELLEE